MVRGSWSGLVLNEKGKDKDKAMRIGELAKRADVGVETVRFYERKGLIAQPLKPLGGGYRHYPAATAGRIRFIRQAQDLGFSLRETRELLSLSADPSAECTDFRERAREKRREVEEKIGRLAMIRAALDSLIGACPGAGAASACTILEALERPQNPATGSPSPEQRPEQRPEQSVPIRL